MKSTDRVRPFATVIAAIATPFEADGSPCPRRLLAHARWLLANGCDGLVMFGSTGESASLSGGERRRLLEHLVSNGVPPQALLVGTGCCAPADTLELTRHAIAAGCAGVLVHPPFFFKNVAEEGVVASYAALVDGAADSRLRLYLYHFPQTTGVPVPASVAEKLMDRYPGTVVGYKDSSGVYEHTCSVLERLPGLEVYVATEARLADFLGRGGAGCVSATANVQPGAIRRLLDAHGTPAEAGCQATVAAVRAALEGPQVVAKVKTVLASLHGDDAWRRVRPPLMPLDADAERQLRAALGREPGEFGPLDVK